MTPLIPAALACLIVAAGVGGYALGHLTATPPEPVVEVVVIHDATPAPAPLAPVNVTVEPTRSCPPRAPNDSSTGPPC